MTITLKELLCIMILSLLLVILANSVFTNYLDHRNLCADEYCQKWTYRVACDQYYGIGNWTTVNIDSIDFRGGYVRNHMNMIYIQSDHTYTCMNRSVKP